MKLTWKEIPCSNGIKWVCNEFTDLNIIWNFHYIKKMDVFLNNKLLKQKFNTLIDAQNFTSNWYIIKRTQRVSIIRKIRKLIKALETICCNNQQRIYVDTIYQKNFINNKYIGLSVNEIKKLNLIYKENLEKLNLYKDDKENLEI